eukprot:jgi/Tetstr1/452489/TSEL_039525.t1
MPLKLRRMPAEQRKKRIAEALDLVGLSAFASRYPGELSGGQQQRVALARAIVFRPPILLLDEPLSNLDAQLRQQARIWLKDIQRELGITTIYVTHDQDEALAMSDRIVVMRGGKIVQLASGSSPRTRRFSAMSDSASDKKENADQPLKVAGRLRNDIILGVFRPGEWLRQIDLQDRLGCSRFAVRQALSELTLARVVEHVPNRGFRVAAPSTTIRSEITDVRLMLELPAATEVVAAATAKQIAMVREAAHAFDAAIEDASFQRLRQLNHEFHRALLEPVANETLANLINELRERDLPGDWSSWTSPSSVSSGIIDIFTDDVTYLDKFDPSVSWISAPFLFDNREHWACFLKTDYFQSILDGVAERDNITVIGDVGPFRRGFRVLVAKDEVGGFQDVQNLKLRLWDNQLIVDIWTALGTDPLVMAWTDVYQSLQTGIVEAVTSPASLVESMKFYEPAPHIVRTDEFNQANVYMINKDSWDSISAEAQEGVLRAYYEVSDMAAAGIDAAFEESLEIMEAQGATYGSLDTGPFIEAASSIYRDREANGDMPAGFLAEVDAARNGCL